MVLVDDQIVTPIAHTTSQTNKKELEVAYEEQVVKSRMTSKPKLRLNTQLDHSVVIIEDIVTAGYDEEEAIEPTLLMSFVSGCA
ncbi:hypothetical protein HDV02_004143 [Globomyces sp. JEL0801]|nr:hypothetical protein HDV02_004143 [Globomyces sp. JEL0801]